MDSEQAREIMERNEGFLKGAVYQFIRKCSERNRTGVVSREDLMQEVSFCFLAEVERYGEEAARAHRLTLLHAMVQAVVAAYPLSVSMMIRTKRIASIFHESLVVVECSEHGQRSLLLFDGESQPIIKQFLKLRCQFHHIALG